ncbi:RHS repeat-associated core domain-containing protein [Dactylosporangium sp. NPDC049140]|uniref:RHS repeat-associated core domain-containing protein n=1 Tax=Dactylosporangium sp. NPDC049140 TaxID=3155647 RepID=UPI0033F12395
MRMFQSFARPSPVWAMCLSLVAGLLAATPDPAAAEAVRYQPAVPPGTLSASVPGRGAPAAVQRVDPDVPAPALAAPAYPPAASATVQIPAPGSAQAVRLGALPLSVAQPGAAGGTSASAAWAASANVPAKVTAEGLDHQAATKLGGAGVATAFVLRRADGQTAAGPVRLTVDYSRFAQAAGGDYAGRLQLVTLPAGCATAPDGPGCADGTPVLADNDLTTRTLAATVDVSGTGATYAVLSTSSGSSGDYRATDLNVAQKWTAGQSGGGFDYTYPIALPEPPYGDAPDLALSYDSSGVDGRTTSTNNQASWVGQGWNIDLPFIERRYKACAEDGNPSWGDLCWSSPYSGDPAGAAYTISIGGHSSELLKAADGSYRMKDDQAYRIDHHTGGPNGDNDGEYWTVSTLDGTQYYLGYGQDQRKSTAAPTNSNWTVPVVSDDSGEPCHQSNLASCQQTYRWNVDEVHSPNETYQVYYYETETNTYRRASSGNDLSYIRGGYLSKIEYGKVWAADAPAPAYVSFTHYNRCTQRVAVVDPDTTPEPTCPTIASSPSSYPDVPTDLICSSGCGKHSPTFFISDMLDSIHAFVRNTAGGYDEVTKWQLKHSYPATGDGSDPQLWLDYVRRIGYRGGTIREAVTAFDGTNLDNRVDYNTSLGVRPLSMRRVTAVHNTYGGETNIQYGHQNACFTGGTGASGWSAWYAKKNGHWDTNTDECYPEYFKPDGAASGWGIFHKYVVRSVTDVDHVGGQPSRVSAYTYLGGAAWHHDDALLSADDQQSWGDWRGYGAVQTVEGSGASTERTVTTNTYFRGMDQDLKVDGTKKSVSLTDYDKHPWPDSHFLQGLALQEQRYRLNADSSLTELASQRWTYWDSGITANGPGLHNAHIIRPATHLTRDLLDGGTWRATETDDVYDTYGLVSSEIDKGDTAVAADDTCTTTSYARNTADWRWMIDYPETVEAHQGPCTGPVIGRTVALYDGATSTDDTVNQPIDGNRTEVRSYLDDGTYSSVAKTYDEQGRVLTETDPLHHITTTVYDPATGFPTNGVTVTDPLGHRTTTWTSPAFGDATKVADANGHDANGQLNGKATERDYDALGRITAIYLASEPRSGGTPSYTFSYATPATGIGSPTGPTVITSRQLQSGTGANAVWLSSYEYDDGFAEPVETQVPSPQSGGREVTVTRYDSRGLTALSSQRFYNAGAPGSGLLNPAAAAIPNATTTSYDALEQKTVVAATSTGSELWRTTSTDHGDHTVTVPPTGGQVVTWTDAFDKTTKTQDYLDATNHQDTTYTYTADHRDLASVTDPNGNVTSYTYDWLGHKLTDSDPDSGAATSTYDLAGNVTSTTDAKGQKISTGYDALNRVTSTWSGDITSGTRLTALTYDSVPGAIGQPASSTTYADGQTYTDAVTGYDARYRVTGRRYTIPVAETGLSDSYDFGYGYDSADHQTSITYPAAGGLPQETVTENYTGLGLPNVLAGADTYVAGTTFSGDGKLTGRLYSPTLQRQYGFDPVTDRLSTIKTLVNGATVQDDGYTYNAGGDVTSTVDRIAGQTQCFGYDGRQRLTSAYTNSTGCAQPADASGPVPYNLGYSYDGAGNITSVTQNGAATTYSYPAQGAGAVRPHAATTIGTNSYGYDANGELVTRTVGGTTSTLTWSQRNQLASVTTAGMTTSYVYDANGERLVRHDPGSTTVFLDGTELTTTGTAAATATRYYTASGATVAERTPAGLTWLTADLQGSQQLAITPGGTVSRQRYLPYGAPRGGAGQTPGDRGFLGKVQDASTGLDLLGSRYYDPAMAMFISPDPLDNNDDPDSANPYGYASGNPTTFADPTGLMVPCESGHGGCGTTGHAGGAKPKSHHSSGSKHHPSGSSHRSSGRSAGHAASKKSCLVSGFYCGYRPDPPCLTQAFYCGAESIAHTVEKVEKADHPNKHHWWQKVLPIVAVTAGILSFTPLCPGVCAAIALGADLALGYLEATHGEGTGALAWAAVGILTFHAAKGVEVGVDVAKAAYYGERGAIDVRMGLRAAASRAGANPAQAGRRAASEMRSRGSQFSRFSQAQFLLHPLERGLAINAVGIAGATELDAWDLFGDTGGE